MPPRASGKIQVTLPNNAPPLIAGDGAKKAANQWIQNPKPLPTKPTAVTYTCSNSRELTAGAYGFSWKAKWTPNPAPCWSTPAFSPNVSGGIVVWNPDRMGGTIYIPRIKTTTVATAKSNPNKSRKRIGVGEEVACVLESAPTGGTVVWTTTGSGGCHIQGDGYSASFTAGDEATSATISASFTATIAEQEVSGTCSTTLTIVEPAAVTGIKLREGIAHHPPPLPPSGDVYAGAYMEVRWHLMPDDVSFYNVWTKELECAATNVTGCYRTAIDRIQK